VDFSSTGGDTAWKLHSQADKQYLGKHNRKDAHSKAEEQYLCKPSMESCA